MCKLSPYVVVLYSMLSPHVIMSYTCGSIVGAPYSSTRISLFSYTLYSENTHTHDCNTDLTPVTIAEANGDGKVNAMHLT